MKIIGKLKTKFSTGNYSWENSLELKVRFKTEGEFFNKKCNKVLVCTNRNVDYDVFINTTLQYLSNEEELKEIAKDMIINWYKNKENDQRTNSKEKQIKELQNAINKKQIIIEMEIK